MSRTNETLPHSVQMGYLKEDRRGHLVYEDRRPTDCRSTDRQPIANQEMDLDYRQNAVVGGSEGRKQK